MKNLTKQTVQAVAETLMRQNGQTTTLDVKNALRSQGYFATQNAVSASMDELAAERNWVYDPNGPYRIYQMNDDLDKQILNLLFSAN